MVLLSSLFIAGWAWASGVEGTTKVEFDSTWLDEVVLIFTGSTLCAGTVLNPGDQVLTAYHCVAAGGRPRVQLNDGRAVDGRVVRVDVKHDLALVALEEKVSAGLSIRDGSPVIAEPVWVIGHPYGLNKPGGFLEGNLRWSVSSGVVSNIGSRAVQVSAPVNPGNSGGPLLSAEGEILGVVSRRIAGDGLGFASRSEAALALVGGIATKRPGPVGGTFALQLVGSTMEGLTYSVGPEVEIALRDRVVLRGNLQLGLGVDSLIQGAEWSGGELSLGLRQRMFRGPFAIRLDAYGGLAAVNRIEVLGSGNRRSSQGTAWLAGGGFSVRNIGVDFGVIGGEARWLVRLKWPGVVSVF
jgi:hypothetical protein